ncbi:hypothetical protein [Mixta intestinalis]|uniref:hypothetical protein n=1 Tax=Mixta intestinalis TaxID=1615494 RepID=UPI00136EA585|nr:hypothetical protein [Mixta intestinalis]
MANFIKLLLFILAGAAAGAGLMILMLPTICGYLVGPIYGEDQMSQNFAIFLIGTPLLSVAGALTGWYTGKRIINRH